MPTIYLGVSKDYSSSGVSYQGSIDATSGSNLGAIQPCPGIFPCFITAKSSVRGNSTVTIASVYAGPNHLVLREFLHDNLPSVGNIVRIETRSRNVKVVGGTYVEPLSALTPAVKPYYVNSYSDRSISLDGLPAEMFSSNVSPAFTVTVNGDDTDAADPQNFVFKKDGFTYSFGSYQLSEQLNAFWTNSVSGDVAVGFSASGLGVVGSNANSYLLGGTSFTPYYPPVVVKYPTIQNNEVLDASSDSTAETLEAHRRSLLMLQASTNAPSLGGFAANGVMTSNFGVQSSPNYIRSFAALNTGYASAVTAGYLQFSFMGTRSDYTAFTGAFGNSGSVSYGADWYNEFFNLYMDEGALKQIAATKPALYFNSAWTSKGQLFDESTITNTFWAGAYPQGLRSGRYEDIQAMQYGYILLNKDTKHLEFMFTAHADVGVPVAEVQVINKLMHAPPRSADFIPASNMLFGIDPRNSTTATSLYNSSDATVKAAFTSDHILHGGGGHVMALGTFNGAIVNSGKVTVWGSNRWGQLIIPTPLRTAGVLITDVAVSNSPPVLANPQGGFIAHSIYSDEVAEEKARNFTSTVNDASTNIYFYSYPYSWYGRYGGHINYTNLPGHVVVVTSAGWVYAWGNNLYYQCEVPANISLLDSSGNVKTNSPTDPIMEVSAGAFHTVARSKAGRVYVWGAGGPWVSTIGRVEPASTSTSVVGAEGASPAQYKSVHFGQSLLFRSGDATTGFAHLANPVKDPPGLTSNSSENYTTFAVYTSIATITQQVTGGASVSIGQVTGPGFSVEEPSGATRMKGMIAAGAFHTAIIDAQLKIQCIGAGRGLTTDYTTPESGYVNNPGSAVIWGTSYTVYPTPDLGADTYPHFCQSMSQYRAPKSTSSLTQTPSQLFRFASSTTAATKSRYFQDLQFKKVVCGPFSTHGIVFSVSRGTTEQFTAADKAHLHGRVVSWGCAFGPRTSSTQGTNCTGILGTRYAPVDPSDTSYNDTPEYNPAGTLSGMGSILEITSNTPRYFEILNRSLGTAGGVYASSSNLVGAPSPNSSAVSSPSVGVVGTNSSTQGSPNYQSDCPVTISRFKVKDMACCGDFAVYIGFLNTFTRNTEKTSPADTSQEGIDAGASYDYQASVFFTGNDVYRDEISNPEPYKRQGRLDANSPYVGNQIGRRNRVDTGNADKYLWPGNKAMPMKTRSLHFGPIKRTATGVVGRLTGDSSDRNIEYVLPTTALASANNVAAIVNMDNRPVAWLGRWFYAAYPASLDLSLLPSVPLQNFKVGKAHVMAVTDGDWPVAVSLTSINQTPKLVSELGARLFTTTVPTVSVAPELIHNEAARYSRPTLIAWGAGDGREYGSSFVSVAPLGLETYPLPSFGFGGPPGTDIAFGLGFLDTHAVSRYDATYTGGNVQGLAVSTDDWENYYGHYRWNVNSTYDKSYTPPPLVGVTTVSTLGGGTAGAMLGVPGHHLVEAMQSLLGFQPHLYPSTFTNPALGARELLNGSKPAAIPAAAYRPFVSSSAQSSIAVRCCATAAEEAGSFESINSLLEYHSPLGYTQQNYTDYVVDYAAGSMHSAVLFKSSCINWSNIESGQHLASATAFTTHFMADVSGAIPFGQRKVCKLGIVGYGCEGQTAGFERRLTDGSVAPLVPKLFSPSAKVYCGESYTLVTDPVRIVEISSGNVSLSGFTDSGSGYTTKTIPITVPAAKYSKRIRGLDVRISVVTSSGTINLPLSSWVVKIPYKYNTWTVFSKLKANLDTTSATAVLAASTTAATYRFSDRFHPSVAYTYGSTDTYDEVGINPTVAAAYSGSAAPYALRPIDTAAAVPALSKQGCYYPVSVGAGDVVTPNVWNTTSPTTAEVVLPFDVPTINVVIEDYTGATSYANCSINVTLEIEVDDGELPYILYGSNTPGVWNELPGRGPSYGADITAFNATDDTGTADNAKSRWLLNCPCVIDPVLLIRKHPVGFLASSAFICGTKKYGPFGNRETAAAQVFDDIFDPYDFGELRKAKLRDRVTANFFSVFTVIPHRPFLGIRDQINTLNPSLQALPPAAFINPVIELPASTLTASSAVEQIPQDKVLLYIGLEIPSNNVQSILLTVPAGMLSKGLYADTINATLNSGLTNIEVTVALSSTNCP